MNIALPDPMAGLITLPSTARPAPTNGWDVVSSTRICDLNAAIQDAGSSPDNFTFERSEGSRGSGAFDPWQIEPYGDGPLINLTLPIRNFVLNRKGKTFEIPHCEATIRVRFEMMPTGKNHLRDDGEQAEEHLLVVRTDLDATILAGDPNARVAEVRDISGMEEYSSRTQSGFILVLEEWLNENIVEFRHVFGTVDIIQITEEEAKGKAFAWLKPTGVSYAFGTNRRRPEHSVLSILCQTAGRSSQGLVHQTLADAIPDGSDAAICISNRRFLRDMVAPGLGVAYPGLVVKEHHFLDNDIGLLINDGIQLEPQTHDGKTYEPVLERLEVLVRTTELKFDSNTRTLVSSGLYSLCHNISWFNFGLLASTHGLTLGYKPTREPVETHEKEHSKEMDILKWMLLAVQVLAAIVLVLVGLAVIEISAMIVWGILTGAVIADRTIDVVDMINEGKGPPIDAFLMNADNAVSWCSGGRFEPNVVGINGSLQIGGKLKVLDSTVLGIQHLNYQARFNEIMSNRRMPS